MADPARPKSPSSCPPAKCWFDKQCTRDGGGNLPLYGGTLFILNGAVIGNDAGNISSQGGGFLTVNNAAPTVIQNLFVGNKAGQGGGLSVGGGNRFKHVNNTIIANSSAQGQGSALFVAGGGTEVQFINNLLIGIASQNAVFCDNGVVPTTQPTFKKQRRFQRRGRGIQGQLRGHRWKCR